MRLPVQVAAVIREAVHAPAVRLFRGLAPSGSSSAHVESVTCSQVLCACAPGPGHTSTTYAQCPTNVCHWDNQNDMCQCGSGDGR
ncbi:MAG TPA: hypothetical protein VMG10_02615 [Gemmataceae bacterium]|nr:hypothetical protein [Gemmataceae bacterium]